MAPRSRTILQALAVALFLGIGAGWAYAADTTAAQAVADLDSPSWATRRLAEGVLESEGTSAVLAVSMEDGTPGIERAREQAAAFWSAVDEGWASGRPSIVTSLRRILARLEQSAPEDAVSRIPRLLRARVDRLLPRTVGRPMPAESDGRDRFGGFPGMPPMPRPRGFPRFPDPLEVDPDAEDRLRGLGAGARALFYDVLSTSHDARRLAGAVLLLAEGDPDGPTDPRVLAALARLAEESPDRAAAMGTLVARDGRTWPLAYVGLALALSFKGAKAAAVLRDSTEAAGLALDLARNRLPALGLGDVAHDHRFLDAAFSGEVAASEAVAAARRALDAGVPWIARLSARRAFFLDREDLGARAALVASAVALRLFATARREAGDRVPLPAGLPESDDAAAKAMDDLVAAGGFGQRLAWSVSLRSTPQYGLPPVAAGADFVAVGDALGDLRILDATTGARRAGASTLSRLMPRAVAVSGPYVAVVSSRSNLLAWKVVDGELLSVSAPAEPARYGPWATIATAGDGRFVLARLKDSRLAWWTPGSDPEPVAADLGIGPPPDSIAALPDGSVLVVRGMAVLRVNTTSGLITPVAEGLSAGPAVPYGPDVLVAHGEAWDRHGKDGTLLASHDDPDGETIVGVAGDPKAGVVYLARAESVVAVDAETGTLLWSEDAEAGGSPVTGGGFVFVPVGRGLSPPGDGQPERRVTALRTSDQGLDAGMRAKTLDAARAAKREGNGAAARLLVDLVWDSLDPRERQAVEKVDGLRPLSSRTNSGDSGDGR